MKYFQLAISFRCFVLKIANVVIFNLGKLNPTKDPILFYIHIAESHKTSYFPFVSISLFNNFFEIGKSIDWEPKILSETFIKEVNGYVYKYKDDKIQFNYYKGTKVTKYKEEYEKGKTEKEEKVWLYDENDSTKKYMNTLKYFPMYNREGNFQHPHEIVKILIEFKNSVGGYKNN